MKKNRKILLLVILVISGIQFSKCTGSASQAVSQKLSPGEADAKANAELQKKADEWVDELN